MTSAAADFTKGADEALRKFKDEIGEAPEQLNPIINTTFTAGFAAGVMFASDVIQAKISERFANSKQETKSE